MTEKTTNSTATGIKADATRDCRGVGCPMNMVYAKVELAKLKPGQVLAILLDDGPPINNVPDNVTRHGHLVLEKIRLEDGNWLLLVQKGEDAKS